MRALLLTLVTAILLGRQSRGQDITWLVEQAPVVSSILGKAFEKLPSFNAKVQLKATSKVDSSLSSASGSLAFQNGNMRWEAKLADIDSAQLTVNAKAMVRQINGDQFLLLTRPDKQVNFLVLSGARACLEESLPKLKYSAPRATGANETIEGYHCFQERFIGAAADGSTNTIQIWRAKDLKNFPVQVQVTHSGGVFRIRLKDIRGQTFGPDRFDLPSGVTKYNSVEDLVQSVMLEKLKRRMGLE